MSYEALREKILEEARREAERILAEAREKAEKILREAREEYERRVEKARRKALQELRERKNAEYVSKVVQLSMEFVKLKNSLLEKTLSKVRERLRNLPPDVRRESLRRLIKEAIESGVFSSDVVVKVVPQDVEVAKSIVTQDPMLRGVVARVEALDDERALGGAVVESIDRRRAVDNTYRARIERALPKLIGRLNEEVFNAGGR